MRDPSGSIIGLDRTWDLMFGYGASLGDAKALYFASGTEGETVGLFGSLRHISDG